MSTTAMGAGDQGNWRDGGPGPSASEVFKPEIYWFTRLSGLTGIPVAGTKCSYYLIHRYLNTADESFSSAKDKSQNDYGLEGILKILKSYFSWLGLNWKWRTITFIRLL